MQFVCDRYLENIAKTETPEDRRKQMSILVRKDTLLCGYLKTSMMGSYIKPSSKTVLNACRF